MPFVLVVAPSSAMTIFLQLTARSEMNGFARGHHGLAQAQTLHQYFGMAFDKL
jgi:hypothetical protein